MTEEGKPQHGGRLDFPPVEEAGAHVLDYSVQVRDAAVAAALVYHRGLFARGQERIASHWPPALAARDRIIYRMDSLCFHERLLVDTQLGALERVVTVPRDGISQLLKHVRDQQGFFFDDLALNGIALFNYLANFVAAALEGPHRHKELWNTMVDKVRDHAAGHAICQTGVGDTVLRNAPFVEKLHRYRAPIAKYRKDVESASYTRSLSDSQTRVDLHVRPTDDFQQIAPVDVPEDAHLWQAGFALVDRAAAGCTEILKALEQDLEESAG